MRILASAILALCLVLIWVAIALTAPVPRAKPATKLASADFVGEWALEWGSGHGVCQLAKDGFYSEQWYGTAWQGRWDLDGDTIRVLEFPVQEDGSLGESFAFEAKLKPGTREGTLKTGGAFSLKPVSKKKPDF